MSRKRRDDPLADYARRRDFSRTSEPAPDQGDNDGDGDGAGRGRGKSRGRAFVVQKHDARREHFDLRLEVGGVLKSWAVTRGPSADPSDRRLAVRTEDHPLSYGAFEGTIPKGEYGGGTVMLWDRGTWKPDGDPERGLKDGKLHFTVDGERMRGEWILVRMDGARNGSRKYWLLMKARDAMAEAKGASLTKRYLRSVATGRTMAEIAVAGKPRTGKVAARRMSAAPRSNRRSDGSRNGRLPAFRKPAFARLVAEAPDGDGWLHELKFDGYRCLVAVGAGRAVCYTRAGLDWTERFASIAEACSRLDCRSALLDGEVVAGETGGGSAFSALQAALKSGGDLRYFAFDLLDLDGEDLRGEPLIGRKERLEGLIATLGGSRTVQYSEHVRGHGGRVYASVCRAGREGIVSKRADSAYSGRRTGDWRKVKCTRRQEFVIGGYSPSDKRGRPFASLLIGAFENGDLVYRGRVGTGFSEDTLADLARRMKPLARRTSGFADAPDGIADDARWLTPRLVAEVEFSEFTRDGYVRHGVFLGLRSDKEAEMVGLERPRGESGSGATVLGVHITHPDRVLYPDQGLTKIALARYYEAVAERMLERAGGRLLSLVRCPRGSGGSCFYQKHGSDGLPDEIRRMDVTEKSGKTDSYLYVEDGAGLVSAVQMGTLEFHTWWSRIDDLERPDRLVFDLDPDEGLGFARVKEAAVELRDRLGDLGLRSLPLVTGGKGVHVVAPLQRRRRGDDVKAFAEGLARRVVADTPDRYTATMSKAKRKGRIFIDWLRNERGATAIAPYSTRARPGAPVATPVGWDELAGLETAAAFRVDDVVGRLADPDPWRAAGDWRQSITARMLSAVAG